MHPAKAPRRRSAEALASWLPLTLALLLAAACSRKPAEPEPARAAPTRGLGRAEPPSTAPAPPPEQPPPPFQFPSSTPPPTNEPKPIDPNAIAAEGEAQAEAEGPPPRDYSSELKALIGSPSGCLKERVGATAPREISVTVEAVVMETGLISRAYARSSELDDEELACIRARLGSARMGPDVEQAPRSVTTTLTMVLQPAPARPAPAEPGSAQAAQQPGAAEPGATPPPEAPPSGYGQPEQPTAPEQPQESP